MENKNTVNDTAPISDSEQKDTRITRRGRRVLRILILSYLGLLIVLGGFVSGLLVGEQRAANNVDLGKEALERVVGESAEYKGEHQDIDFALFWQVWGLVQQKYVKQPVEDSSLFDGAISGIVASLDDPYSTYFDPETAQQFSDDLHGTFSGIGAEIGIKNDFLVIVSPLPDSPAEGAGLLPGDRIIGIDDKVTIGVSIEEAVSLIRGETGTEVRLNILRKTNGDEPFEMKIIRDTIVVKPVEYEVKRSPGGVSVGYISIRQFNEDTVSLFSEAVKNLQRQKIGSIILDLRSNPGGFLSSAVEVSSEWVGRDIVLVERKSGGEEETYSGNRRARLAGTPTVVLVNGGTASGSEIVAGALQDGRYATIVGEQTFGKGSVQDYEELPGGGALKLTIAEWLTPKLRAINEVGIAPDIVVELTNEDYNEDKDPQLEKAFELIEKGLAAKGY